MSKSNECSLLLLRKKVSSSILIAQYIKVSSDYPLGRRTTLYELSLCTDSRVLVHIARYQSITTFIPQAPTHPNPLPHEPADVERGVMHSQICLDIAEGVGWSQ